MAVSVYYWGMLGRSSAAQRMLTCAGIEYSHKSDFGEIAEKASAFGAQGPNFAPPILVDGDLILSQSSAVTMHAGEKAGFDKGVHKCLAVQFMSDIGDFGSEISKACGDADSLHAFLHGKEGAPGPGRCAAWLATLEAQIKGPFYFGDEPSYVDFYLAQALDWTSFVYFGPVVKAGGANPLKDAEKYPKVNKAWQGILDMDKVKSMTAVVCNDGFPGIMKDAIAQAYVAKTKE
jgi:glutathione S-transferase